MSSPAEQDDRVAAVVPTLDRIHDLTNCLDAIAAQSRVPDATYVVDNGSSDGTAEAIAARKEVELVAAGVRLGAPGAFASGIRRAFAAEMTWVWLLDDDCVPATRALEELLATAGPDRAAAGAAPTVVFGDGRREAGWHWGARAQAGDCQSPNVGAGDVDWAPFAGLLLRRGACEQVGEVRADYFLWHADVEYGLRLRSAGWRLLAALGAEVFHPAMPMVERRLLGRRISVGRIAPWREYYDTRNLALLRRQLRDTPFAHQAPLRRRLTAELKRDAAVLLADPAGLRRVGMRALGHLDGFREHMTRRPETKIRA